MTNKLSNLFLFTALGMYMTMGFFSRLESDDFCELLIARLLGPIGLPVTMYVDWTGRFSLLGSLGALFGLLDERVPALVPMLLLVGLVASATYALRPMFPRHAFTLALAFTVSLLLASTNRLQLLYWSSGSLMVVTPVIFAALLAGLIQRRQPIILIMVVSVISVGFNEPFALVEGLLLGIWFLRSRTRFTAAAVVGAAMGVILILLSPGNAHRAASSATQQQVLFGEAAGATGAAYLLYLQNLLFGTPLALALPFAAGWWLRPIQTRFKLSVSVGLILMTLVVGYMTLLVVAWLGVIIGSRHEVIMTVLVIAVSFSIGSMVSKGTTSMQPLLTCAILSLLFSLAWMTQTLPVMIVHSQLRDQGYVSNLFANEANIGAETTEVVQVCKMGLSNPALVSLDVYPPRLVEPQDDSSTDEST